MRQTIFIILAAAAVVGVGTGVYLWYKPHKNMERAKADLTLSATDLMADFNNDESAANAKYLDKVVAVKGAVQSINDNNGVVTISLEAGDDFGAVSCELDNQTKQPRTNFAPGDVVTLKGICAGKTIDVVLVRCMIVE